MTTHRTLTDDQLAYLTSVDSPTINGHSRRSRPARFRGVFTMASNYATDVFNSRPMCQVYYEQWLKWLEISGRDRDEAASTAW